MNNKQLKQSLLTDTLTDLPPLGMDIASRVRIPSQSSGGSGMACPIGKKCWSRAAAVIFLPTNPNPVKAGRIRDLGATLFDLTPGHPRKVAVADLDLLRLVSRPLPSTPWSYRFDAVVAGHPLDPILQRAFDGLSRATRTYRIVGVYEGAGDGP